MGLEPSGSWNRPRINKVWAFALAWVGVLITIGSGNTHPHRSKNSYVSCLVAFYLARLFFFVFFWLQDSTVSQVASGALLMARDI